MNQNSSEDASDDRKANQTMLKSALATMSTEQLIELRSTAHRLKHLPFSRLVAVLFAEAVDSPMSDPGCTEHEPPKHNFAGESPEECRSEFLRDLFGEIERALVERSPSDESHSGDNHQS